MAKLKDHPFWLGVWVSVGGSAPNAGEIRQDGVFETCSLSSKGLQIVVDYKGQTVSVFISFEQAGDLDLTKLRDLLLLYKGQPMRVVEDLEIDS